MNTETFTLLQAASILVNAGFAQHWVGAKRNRFYIRNSTALELFEAAGWTFRDRENMREATDPEGEATCFEEVRRITKAITLAFIDGDSGELKTFRGHKHERAEEVILTAAKNVSSMCLDARRPNPRTLTLHEAARILAGEDLAKHWTSGATEGYPQGILRTYLRGDKVSEIFKAAGWTFGDPENLREATDHQGNAISDAYMTLLIPAIAHAYVDVSTETNRIVSKLVIAKGYRKYKSERIAGIMFAAARNFLASYAKQEA